MAPRSSPLATLAAGGTHAVKSQGCTNRPAARRNRNAGQRAKVGAAERLHRLPRRHARPSFHRAARGRERICGRADTASGLLAVPRKVAHPPRGTRLSAGRFRRARRSLHERARPQAGDRPGSVLGSDRGSGRSCICRASSSSRVRGVRLAREDRRRDPTSLRACGGPDLDDRRQLHSTRRVNLRMPAVRDHRLRRRGCALAELGGHRPRTRGRARRHRPLSLAERSA